MIQPTIAACATALGQAGIGIVRIAGDKTAEVARQLLHFQPTVRYAHYTPFYAADGTIIDQGIALFYRAPHSFTGDDVLELHCHGGRYPLEMVLDTVISLGVEPASAGEFSKRAFLNGKIDLLQAEAIADLIKASSKQAARGAIHSLTGVFSAQINNLFEQVTALRVWVEATIDFSDEELDFIPADKVTKVLDDIDDTLHDILQRAEQGNILHEGVHIVIAGKPNAGKSSLFNALTEVDSAIVTDIAGTTRDTIKEHILIDGVPFNVIDTAGLHQSDDKIEQEGMKRARAALLKADIVLWVYDGRQQADYAQWVKEAKTLLLVKNKGDLFEHNQPLATNEVVVSAKTKTGLDELRKMLKKLAGIQTIGNDVVLARTRHLLALKAVSVDIKRAKQQAIKGSVELIAEELRQAQYHLGEITGRVSSDELLGKIFSSFCIGK